MKLLDIMPDSWKPILEEELQKPYIGELEAFLSQEFEEQTIYPPQNEIFSAFEYTSYDNLKVFLLGQDPYHGEGQAHGLSFSVKPGVKTPPSLRNMFKELKEDLGCEIPNNGCLTPWAKQGVLMLNAVLTVRASKPASHKKQGWEKFTDAVIKKVNEREEPIVFLLWGGFAKKKAKLIDADKHVVITGTHPSPLSAKNGFFGSKPYSEINEARKGIGKEPSDWQIPNID